MAEGDSAPGARNRRDVVVGGLAGVALAYGATAAAPAVAQDDRPVAKTRSGRVRGYADGPVRVFKGVPYGADTGGANRWLPPKPPAPWTNVREVVEQGPMCPQKFGAPMAEETALLQRGPMSEDCLNLNVWTPQVGAGKRPVMVWYHGGGFSAGSGGATTYNGRNLCQKHDVVLVTVTHRLNVFGFLYLEELYGPAYAASGNVGLLDCVAALDWVRANIAAFGGDPERVTIFGQSGGAGKVSAMMGMPDAKGLFHRAIVESGGVRTLAPPQAAAASARKVVETAGAHSLAELQAVPADRLLQAMATAGLQPGPMLDGKVMPANPFSPTASPLSRDVPLLCGTTRTEAVFFPTTPLDPIGAPELHTRLKAAFAGIPDARVDELIQAVRSDDPHASDVEILQLVLSQNFGSVVGMEADHKAEGGGAPVFVYYFAHTVAARGGKLGAPHTAEIPYAMDSLAQAKPLVGPVTAPEQALADKLSACWTSFARHGDPNNPAAPTWTPYDAQTRPTMVVDDGLHMVDDPMGRTRALLVEIRKAYPPAPPGAPPPAPTR